MSANYLPCPCAESIGDPLVYAPPANPCVTQAKLLGRQTQQISCMDGVVVDSCVANLGTNLIEYWKSESVPNTGSVGSRVMSNGGDVTGVAGKIGTGWSFPGTANSYLTCPDDAALRLNSGDFTIRTWVYVNSAHATKAQTLFDKLDIFAPAGWWVTIDSVASGSSLTFWGGSGGGNQGTASGPIPLGSWVHLVIVSLGGLLQIYFNAATQIGAVNPTPAIDSSTAVLYLGQLDENPEDASNTRFVGRVDELLISSYGWTQADVTCDYNSGNGRTYPFS